MFDIIVQRKKQHSGYCGTQPRIMNLALWVLHQLDYFTQWWANPNNDSI